MNNRIQKVLSGTFFYALARNEHAFETRKRRESIDIRFRRKWRP
ncbi:MAG: hypothetical protein ACK5HT_18795 [Draconibacterium sp.]